MTNLTELTDEEWQAIYSLLLLNQRIYVGCEEKSRRFLNVVLWILRGGTQWRLLPAALGHWNSVFKRFSRGGVWEVLHKSCIQYPDLQQILIDSTITRAYVCGRCSRR